MCVVSQFRQCRSSEWWMKIEKNHLLNDPNSKKSPEWRVKYAKSLSSHRAICAFVRLLKAVFMRLQSLKFSFSADFSFSIQGNVRVTGIEKICFALRAFCLSFLSGRKPKYDRKKCDRNFSWSKGKFQKAFWESLYCWKAFNDTHRNKNRSALMIF